MTIIKMDEKEYLKRLVEELTHSGEKTLHKHKLQNLIKICMKDGVFVEIAYKDLSNYLKEEHSEVKLSSIQLINELFLNFPAFRKLTVENIKRFYSNGSCIDRKEPMPPPKWASLEARKLCFMVIYDWYKKYGSKYRLLHLAINRLKMGYNVDFTDFEIVDPKEKLERIEREKRMLIINKEMLKKVTEEMNDLKIEMDSTLTSIQSCFSLLLPSPDEFMDKIDQNDKFEDLRIYGVLNRQGFSVNINIDEKIKIEESEENRPILDAALDSYKMIKNRFLPKTIVWFELLQKTDGSKENLKIAQRQKEVLQGALAKYEKLDIINTNNESSDSDFEEVVAPKEKKTTQKEEITFFSKLLDNSDKIKENKNVEKDKNDIPSSSNDRKSQLLKIAPKLPYDIDLYHWEETDIQAPKVIPVNLEGSSIWSTPISDLSEMSVPGGSESLRSRVIEFTGKFEPVQRACRALLPSGKLCPRFDRIKCPFHGRIVDRDEQGNVINIKDREELKKNRTQIPDWQDPTLLAEIKAKTGIDLEMPIKGKRKKKPKYPGLTDIKTKVDNPKTRIAKKIFDKKAVKRVANSLDKLDHKRHRDKFGDQFNYMHDTS